MDNILSDFLDEVQTIYLAIWQYTHSKKNHPLHCYKTEGLTSIKIMVNSEECDYLTGPDIERCIEIAKSHQETCFNSWNVEMARTIVETKKGHMVSMQTPLLVIRIYQRCKEETEQ